jgi:hypothetical protein
MMMKRISMFFTFILFTLVARAHPLAIEFYEMIDASKLIVIANSIKPIGTGDLISIYEINITTILKGKGVTGTYTVKRAKGSPNVPLNSPFIAFINRENEFEWCGLPIAENQAELSDNSVLSLAGFYDFNAYLVSPSVITLGQLKQYIKEKKYSNRISGNLYCFSNSTKKLESTPVNFIVNYTYTKDGIKSSTTVSGISWKGFPAKPELSVSAWDNEISLEFETNGYRAFVVDGVLLPVPDSNGTIQARFWVTDPDELSFDELKEYLTNEIHGFPSYELEITTDKNETYQLMLGEEMGRIGVFMYEGKKLGISSYNIDPYWPREIVMEYNYYDKLVISLDSTAITKDQLEFTHEKMVRELKVNPIKGQILMRSEKGGDKLIANCELKYVATKFTQYINYGKN